MAGAIQKKTPPGRKRGARSLLGLKSIAGGALAMSGQAKPSVGKAALNSVTAGLDEAFRLARETNRSVRMTVLVEPDKRVPSVAVEAMAESDDLDAAIAEARSRGAARAAQILAGPDMLSADAFADLIGMTREAVRQKAMRREALGLQGAKRGVRYPAWQVTRDGGLLPDLPLLFAQLGDSPWGVYRFLTQPSPAFKGAPPLDALRAGSVKPVLKAAEGIARGDFG